MQNRDRSLSPLSKDPFSIGKLVSMNQKSTFSANNLQNPEDTSFSHQKHIGQIISPITHQNSFHSYNSKRSGNQNNVARHSMLQEQNHNKRMNKNSRKVEGYKKKLGVIAHTPPKQFSNQFNLSFNETKLGEYVKNIHNNRQVMTQSSQDIYISKQNVIKNKLTPIKDQKRDPEENDKLQNKFPASTIFRISKTKNARKNPQTKKKLFEDHEKLQVSQEKYEEKGGQSISMSKNKNKVEFTQQFGLDSPSRSNSHSRIALLENIQTQTQTSFQHYQKPDAMSNSFVKVSTNKATLDPDEVLLVDLRTSISKIKSTLIQSSKTLHVSFRLQEVFFDPPSPSSSLSDIHKRMKEMFDIIGIFPQIVSVKKHPNYVMMRDKKLCIIWHYSGQIYFGGWKNDFPEGLGLQWFPSRQIYYGEFHFGKKEGYGVLKKSNKQSYIGCWKNNKKQGWGKIYNHEGQLIQNGQFVDGNLICDKRIL